MVHDLFNTNAWIFHGGRRGFWPLMLLLVLAVLAQAACAPAARQERSPQDEIVAAVPAGSAARALEAAAERYAGLHGAQVRVVEIPADAYSDRVSAALLAGLDAYDLLYLPADTVAGWVRYHALRPLSAQVDIAPLAPWLPPLTFSDGGAERRFALPIQPDPLVLWYRADWLEAAGIPGPPAGLEDFRAAALALNAPPERYGFAAASGELDAGQDYAALLSGAPGGLLTAFRGAERETARNALALYAGLASGDGTAPPGAGRYTRGDVIDALREGRAAMGFAPLSAAAGLLDCSISPRACAGDRPLLAAAGLPGNEGCAVLQNFSAWVVPLRSANPAAAEDFAAWLVSAEGARAWAEGGGLPAHTGLLQNPPETALGGMLPDSVVPVLARAECYRPAFPNRAGSEQLWNVLHRAAHAAAAGELPVDAAFERAVQEMDLELRQEGAAR